MLWTSQDWMSTFCQICFHLQSRVMALTSRFFWLEQAPSRGRWRDLVFTGACLLDEVFSKLNYWSTNISLILPGDFECLWDRSFQWQLEVHNWIQRWLKGCFQPDILWCSFFVDHNVKSFSPDLKMFYIFRNKICLFICTISRMDITITIVYTKPYELQF